MPSKIHHTTATYLSFYAAIVVKSVAQVTRTQACEQTRLEYETIKKKCVVVSSQHRLIVAKSKGEATLNVSEVTTAVKLTV